MARRASAGNCASSRYTSAHFLCGTWACHDPRGIPSVNPACSRRNITEHRRRSSHHGASFCNDRRRLNRRAADVAIMVVGNHPWCDAGWEKCPLAGEGPKNQFAGGPTLTRHKAHPSSSKNPSPCGSAVHRRISVWNRRRGRVREVGARDGDCPHAGKRRGAIVIGILRCNRNDLGFAARRLFGSFR